ncbi:TnsA endonuclease N-terminal domain-containing protein [bacterium]|nr:TnsA endonuclease N-terminal domain-containing protein [bacterium]
MTKFHQGKYPIKNAQKYAGGKTPTFRSSWEHTFMNFCDENPNIVAWASEPVKITYQNPLTGKVTGYVPDFVITYIDASGKKHAELVEIKPSSQTKLEFAKGRGDQAQVAINYAKWEAATSWAKKRGMKFRVLNEGDIYQNTKKPKVRKPRKKK